MNCQNHPEVPATAYCRSCGKPVCEQCRRDAFGTVSRSAERRVGEEGRYWRDWSSDVCSSDLMNCQNHPEVPATAYCRSCGKPVCEQCRRDAFGTVYCEEHAPAPAARAAEP